jgi:hypothetical protein
MINEETNYKSILSVIPDRISYSEILSILYKEKGVNWEYVLALKDLTGFTNNELANCLNVGVYKLNTFKKPQGNINIAKKEHILFLLILLKKGGLVFGSYPSFIQWLYIENFFFDKMTPIRFLNTISGICFIYNRLTAMEYGDNV